MLSDNRDFRLLWAAQGVSAVGSRITRTALPVMAVLTVGGSAMELALLAALSLGPGAIVGFLAGGWIDRTSKRRILVGADIVRALLVLTVPLCAWAGALAMWQLYLVAAAVGIGSALFEITDNTYLPSLVDREDLVAANSRLEGTDAVAEISGPGLAGVLIEALTAPVAMILDAVTYLFSAVLLGRIECREVVRRGSDTDRGASDLLAGYRACVADPMVSALLVTRAISTFFGGFFFALYMLFTLDVLELSPAVVGLVISVGGVGGVIGAALASALLRRLGLRRALITACLLAQAGSLLIPLASGPIAMKLAFLVAHQLVGDGFAVAYYVHEVSLRQQRLPADLLGRANALFHLAGSGVLVVGTLAAGVVGDWLGVRNAIWLGVCGGLLAPLVLAARLRRGSLPQAQAAR